MKLPLLARHTGSFTAIVSSFLLLASLIFGLIAAWIPLKAYAAQVLLEQAWQETLAGENKVNKPWSWADTWPVARIVVPLLDIDYIVLNGVSGESLAFGPGQISNSNIFDVNVGDELSNFKQIDTRVGNHSRIIAGHKDTHFEFLQHLNIGDKISMQNNLGLWQEYSVSSKQVVTPIKGEIPVSPSLSEITLVTCYPFTATVLPSKQRYVVTITPVFEPSAI